MHKRARMTTEDVLDELEVADDQDDYDESMMPGSDDEFGDCELEEEDLEDEGNDGDEQPLMSVKALAWPYVHVRKYTEKIVLQMCGQWLAKHQV